MTSKAGTSGRLPSGKTVWNDLEIDIAADFSMDIDPSYGSRWPCPFVPADDDVPESTIFLPNDLCGEVLTYLSIFDTARFAQVNKLFTGAVHLAVVSDVFVLLHDASAEQVDAALAAIPVMPPSHRLVLLGAMIRHLIAIDRANRGYFSDQLGPAVEEAWKSLPKDDNVYRSNAVRQSYLISKSLLLPLDYRPFENKKLEALLENIHAMPVQYRPKILGALYAYSGFVHVEQDFGCLDYCGRKQPYLFDTSFQLLLDRMDALVQPVPRGVQSAMAVVMLLGSPCKNVKEMLCERFAISTGPDRDRFEADVVAELVSRMPYHLIHLEPLLSRWSVESMSIRRSLHNALALRFICLPKQLYTPRVWLHLQDVTILKPERAIEWALGMPEDTIPGFSDVDASTMRFWELAWAREWTFSRITDHLQAILEMPWQMQPTLFGVLMRHVDSALLSNDAFDLNAWSTKMAARCISQGYFTAALRALLVPFKLGSSTVGDRARDARLMSLRTAHDVALADIPVPHWWPLIEAMQSMLLCTQKPDEWPRLSDVVALVTRFVSDITSVYVPPMSEQGRLTDLFSALWDFVPDQATETASRFEVFCHRMNIDPVSGRENLKKIWINMGKKIQRGEITEEEAVMQLGTRDKAA